VSYGESKFKFKATLSPLPASSLTFPLAEKTSDSFICFRYRLKVEDFPSVWYRDQGGKRNHFPFIVKLVEGFGEEVICDLNIPLKITIHYFNGLLLTRQEMLAISPDSDLRINPETGQTLLKVKLAELSSKHEGNLFFLRISSSDPLIGGICPILTSGVEVRSKDTSTNKRSRPMSDPSEGIDQSSTHSSSIQRKRANTSESHPMVPLNTEQRGALTYQTLRFIRHATPVFEDLIDVFLQDYPSLPPPSLLPVPPSVVGGGDSLPLDGVSNVYPQSNSWNSCHGICNSDEIPPCEVPCDLDDVDLDFEQDIFQ